MSSIFLKSLRVRGVVTLVSAANLLAAPPARAEVKNSPSAFHVEQNPVGDGTRDVRIGGSGSAVVLLHGFGDTGDLGVFSLTLLQGFTFPRRAVSQSSTSAITASLPRSFSRS